ncbi:MAG: hypothetical protein M3092_02040 [Actinomycetia bacterium]|nr:hypothetical protein [Actinomycetes bacterium]
MHNAMFDQVWEWAGRYRIRETNIGVAIEQISSEIRNLAEDTKTWVDTAHTNRTQSLFDSIIAWSLSTRSRTATDATAKYVRQRTYLLIASFNGEPFTWGARLDADTDDLRGAYLHALRRADGGDIEELLAFART